MLYIRKKITYFHLVLFTLIGVLFFSCSPQYTELKKQNKIEKKQKKNVKKEQRKNRINERNSKSEFKAYYNSYYLAKVKFKDALEELLYVQIENKSTNRNNNSIKLLDDAIKYSDIVLDDFYNTKYWFDAAYIKARSSYIKNIFSSANYYFNQIIEDKNSPYYYDSLVRLGFISLRLNDVTRLSSIIEELDENINNFESNIKKLDKKNPYKFIKDELLLIKSNYYILKAENALFSDSPIDEVEYYYLLAIENSNNQNHINNIYSTLLSLFKVSNNKSKILEYTNKIISRNRVNEDDISSDTYLKDWFEFSRNLNLHNDIYKYINVLEKQAVNIEDEIYLMLEKGKTHFSDGNTEEAIALLNNLLFNYEEDLVLHKDYFSEIYYYLGEIFLKIKNDYEEALNYFDLSIEKKSIDNPSMKKSEALNSYLELYDQYLIGNISDNQEVSDSLNINGNNQANNFYIPIPDTYNYESNNTDTLLFEMGSILYFDLDMKDEALLKFELVYNNHIDSRLIPQVIKILQAIDPGVDWRRSFLGNLKSFSDNKEIVNNALVDNRAKAFRKMNSSLSEAIDIFENNFNQYDDLLSLYMVAFIYDIYLNNPYESVKFYNKYLDYENADNINIAKKRLSDIEKILNDEISITKQKISYADGLQYLLYDTSIGQDSLLYSLEECEKGESIDFRKKCKSLLDILEFPSPEELSDTLSNTIITKWSNNKNMDWQIFNIAKKLYEYTKDNNLVSQYCQLLINYYKDSDYIDDAYLLLIRTDPSQDWSSLLSDKLNKSFLEIEKFNPRTGLDVINAYMERPIPLTISSKNIIHKIYKDSLKQNNMPEDIYLLKYKKNIFSDDKNDGEKFFISKTNSFNDNEIYYSLDKNSILKWDKQYSSPKELLQDSYYLDENIPIIKESISTESKGYRYNINNTKSECFYLDEPYFCYEVKGIPNEDEFYRTMWFLEIEDNIFLKIKENISNIQDELFFKSEITYKKMDSFYLVDKVKTIDLKKDMIKVLNINDININKDIFKEDLTIKNKKKTDVFDLEVLNERLINLISMKHTLFPEPIEENISNNITIDSTSSKSFEYVQSINQYFYFVEAATINGIELNNKDWIVAYNQDTLVGARQYTIGGRVDVPVMGYDNSSESTKISTEGYCKIGDIPIIKVYRENGDIITMDVTLINDDGKLEFQSIGHVYVILQKD